MVPCQGDLSSFASKMRKQSSFPSAKHAMCHAIEASLHLLAYIFSFNKLPEVVKPLLGTATSPLLMVEDVA